MSNKATAQPLSIKFLTSSFLVFWLVLAAFPFMWTLWGSFKVEGDFFSKADWANALFGGMTKLKPAAVLPMTGIMAHGYRKNSGALP